MMPFTETKRCVHTVRITDADSFEDALKAAILWWKSAKCPVIWDISFHDDMLVIYHDGFEPMEVGP